MSYRFFIPFLSSVTCLSFLRSVVAFSRVSLHPSQNIPYPRENMSSHKQNDSRNRNRSNSRPQGFGFGRPAPAPTSSSANGKKPAGLSLTAIRRLEKEEREQRKASNVFSQDRLLAMSRGKSAAADSDSDKEDDEAHMRRVLGLDADTDLSSIVGTRKTEPSDAVEEWRRTFYHWVPPKAACPK